MDVDGRRRRNWLLLFKNETHNHPTEIEPFGGAATCIGGAIRDPLSGRGYVYQAMRVTGAADPTQPGGKDATRASCPSARLVTTAAAGYSSYGNQIGLATGLVEEIYHPGYAAKAHGDRRGHRRGSCARTCAVRSSRSGRRGGAAGRTHRPRRLRRRDGLQQVPHGGIVWTACGAEVQKGNAPEERKLQRLFRNREGRAG